MAGNPLSNFTNTAFVLARIKAVTIGVGVGVEEGLEEAGLRGVGIVKGNTPVDTGRLRNSMAYTVKGKVVGGVEGEDRIKQVQEDKVVVVGTNVIYGPSVEYMSKTGSKGFMLRSFYQWKPIADLVIADAIRKGIK